MNTETPVATKATISEVRAPNRPRTTATPSSYTERAGLGDLVAQEAHESGQDLDPPHPAERPPGRDGLPVGGGRVRAHAGAGHHEGNGVRRVGLAQARGGVVG